MKATLGFDQICVLEDSLMYVENELAVCVLGVEGRDHRMTKQWWRQGAGEEDGFNQNDLPWGNLGKRIGAYEEGRVSGV